MNEHAVLGSLNYKLTFLCFVLNRLVLFYIIDVRTSNRSYYS